MQKLVPKTKVVALVNRARNDQPKSQHERFWLNIGINLLTGRIVKHWDRLPE